MKFFIDSGFDNKIKMLLRSSKIQYETKTETETSNKYYYDLINNLINTYTNINQNENMYLLYHIPILFCKLEDLYLETNSDYVYKYIKSHIGNYVALMCKLLYKLSIDTHNPDTKKINILDIIFEDYIIISGFQYMLKYYIELESIEMPYSLVTWVKTDNQTSFGMTTRKCQQRINILNGKIGNFYSCLSKIDKILYVCDLYNTFQQPEYRRIFYYNNFNVLIYSRTGEYILDICEYIIHDFNFAPDYVTYIKKPRVHVLNTQAISSLSYMIQYYITYSRIINK